MPNALEFRPGDASTSSADKWYPVTKADADLPNGKCRALACGTAGTVNLMDGDGDITTAFPLQVGYNPIMPRQVRTGGTALDIWALY